MAAVRHATVIFLFLTITFAAMANGAGETDPDPARDENPVDCMIGCASRQTFAAAGVAADLAAAA